MYINIEKLANGWLVSRYGNGPDQFGSENPRHYAHDAEEAADIAEAFMDDSED